jgi:CRISPR/Cas system-associated endoribonuclease Cas2
MFFDDLEKLDQIKSRKKAYRSAYYRAIRSKLIEINDAGIPVLTQKGRRKIKPYKSSMIKGASLLVIFDIPESESFKRRRFRLLLKELKFYQVQKSVWQSSYDHRDHLRAEIADMNLEEYVKVYESAQVEI